MYVSVSSIGPLAAVRKIVVDPSNGRVHVHTDYNLYISFSSVDEAQQFVDQLQLVIKDYLHRSED